jgi:steroid 5-alpha reductase family enzyme
VAVLLGGTMTWAINGGVHSIIDTVWGLGFVWIAAVSFVLSTLIDDDGNVARRVIVLALTAIWGIRLGSHIFIRNHGHGEDPRYEALLRSRKDRPLIPFLIKKIYGMQGAVMWLVSIPVQLAMYESAGLGIVTWVGVALWVIGFYFEAVGDLQLTRFRKDPANKGKTMDTGLWALTRHPNYFGDSCLWFGLFLIACSHWLGIVTIFSPLVMTILLVKYSGAALTEKMMARKRGPEYQAYLARTSYFFPLPPKRVAAASTSDTSGS